jgi:hypothetical protein
MHDFGMACRIRGNGICDSQWGLQLSNPIITIPHASPGLFGRDTMLNTLNLVPFVDFEHLAGSDGFRISDQAMETDFRSLDVRKLHMLNGFAVSIISRLRTDDL